MPIKSSSFSPVYNTNTNGDLVVEVLNSSSGSETLPPNAATATNQTTTNNLLSPIGLDVNNLKSNVAAILPFLGIDVTAIRALLPASLGAKTAANSLSVTLATDGVASSIANQIGEVAANPTANTVLARLKTIGDNTARANITLSTQNLGTANAGVIKNSSGQVFSVYAENENTAKRYLLLLNQTATPVNSQVPAKAYGIPANGAIVLDAVYFGANGLSFATGIAWAFSSTKSTVTLANATDCVMEVGYV